MHDHRTSASPPVEGPSTNQDGLASPPRVAFSNLGCKVNAAETEGFISAFLARGYRVVDYAEEADVYVVNTCTVTTAADRKSRQEIRQAGRANPLALVAATGCYVSVANRDLTALLPGNLLVVHNREKERLVERVEAELALRRSCTDLALRPATLPGPLPAGRAGAPAPLLPVAVGAAAQRTRATLKVQDGCNAGCTFCIIPRARGGPRSVPIEEAVRAARALEEHGYREIVLTGVLLGSYGRDLPDTPTLATLLERLLAATARPRFRVSSVEPQDLHPAWLDLWGDPRLCRHLHLPLQSGSDRVLAGMRRHYTSAAYVALAERARAALPDLALTTDIMVGFPGEDEAAFAKTMAVAERLDFAGVHVFRYSSRPGTPAARLPGQVDEAAKTERGARLRLWARDAAARFHARFIGGAQPVLWEQRQEGVWHGATGNYLHVYTETDDDLRNRLQWHRLVRPYGAGLWAAPRPTAPGPDGEP